MKSETREIGEPTSNFAKRTISRAVLYEDSFFRLSVGEGARFVEGMVFVFESLRAKGRSIIESREGNARGSFGGQPPRSLSQRRSVL
jgi:hypothetical protein